MAVKRISWAAVELPYEPGAYGLLMALARPMRLAIRSLGPHRLEAGAYLYLGSAFGPGGIKARVTRHLRKGKPVHWHVDHLTRRVPVMELLIQPGGSECRLADLARSLPGVHVPVPGFGSSDCRHCPSHLLALNDGRDAVMAALAAQAGAVIRRA